MDHILKQAEVNPNIPILGQPQVIMIPPVISLEVGWAHDDQQAFEAGTLFHPTVVRSFILEKGGSVSEPFTMGECDQWMSKYENCRDIHMHYIRRTIGCCIAMARSFHEDYQLDKSERKKIRELTPTPPSLEKGAPQPAPVAMTPDRLEAVKAQFLRDNPGFNPDILRDGGATALAEAKKNLEGAHFQEGEVSPFGPRTTVLDTPVSPGGVRSPKALNPGIIIP